MTLLIIVIMTGRSMAKRGMLMVGVLGPRT
jgi:hypothetical protein